MKKAPIKVKINNSYESEPSSGSGSSLNETNDYAASDDDVMNLPYLLRPRVSYQSVAAVELDTACGNSRHDSVQVATSSTKILSVHQEESEQQHRQMRYGVPVHSSEESSFEGFTESQINNQRSIFDFGPNLQQLQLLQTKTQYRNPSPGKLQFAKFYDVVIDQNSCNAVDMQLSNEISSSNHGDRNETNLVEPDQSGVLTFNGKIKSLRIANTDETQNKHYHHLSNTRETSICSSAMKYTNEKSPDLFGDDADEDNDNCVHDEINAEKGENEEYYLNNKSLNCQTESSFADDQTLDASLSITGCTSEDSTANLFRANVRREKELLRRIKKCLAGVPPPPALTIPQLDIFKAILENKEAIMNFNRDVNTKESLITCCDEPSLFKPTHTLEESKSMPWKEILGVRQHGLSFNLTKASESNEMLSLAVIERFIGAETASSYQKSPSSAKKRTLRLKMLTQSPGNRLSHLAKRRAIFSSANLATTSQKSGTNAIGGMQILLDKKKVKKRRKSTPKRITPGSKKKNLPKTPSSSAKKSLFRCDLVKPGPSRETSKRALFQSPAKQLQQKYAAPRPVIKPEIANRVEKSKRALFSPDKSSQSSNTCGFMFSGSTNGLDSLSQSSQSSLFGNLDSLMLKRKRNANDDDNDALELANSSKIFRGGENLTPRALKIKSQSFCMGAGSSMGGLTRTASGSSNNVARGLSSNSAAGSGMHPSANGKLLIRACSDSIIASSQLSDNHRKKLLWAVSQALQIKHINAKHEHFKQYAAVLARVVKRLFQEFFQKSSTSTSETMLKLAKKYVYNVIGGKSADDIYLLAKSSIDDELKRMSTLRLSGYISHEEYEKRKNALLQNNLDHCQSMSSFAASETSMDSSSFSISQASSFCNAPTSLLSQTNTIDRISQNHSVVSSVSLQHNANDNSSDLFQDSKTITHQKLPIQPNPSLQNSSSKNNLSSIALRENVDCEQRRSTQKNFTGKDQRNVSPYVKSTTTATLQRYGSGMKQTTNIKDLNSSTAKAKRQISFDS